MLLVGSNAVVDLLLTNPKGEECFEGVISDIVFFDEALPIETIKGIFEAWEPCGPNTPTIRKSVVLIPSGANPSDTNT